MLFDENKRLPFAHRQPTSEEITQLQEGLLSVATKPNKKGDLHVSGESFAQVMAGIQGIEYTNNRAPFDATTLGYAFEIKKGEHNPYKDGFLTVELMNGTSNVWEFISKVTNSPRYQVEMLLETADDAQKQSASHETGEALIDFCWARWSGFATEHNFSLEPCKIIMAQMFRLSKNSEHVCQIYTMPLLRFPQRGELQWSFEGKKKDRLSGKDASGREKLSFYWRNNGQVKFYPMIDECILESPMFRTHLDAHNELVKKVRELGVKEFLERTIKMRTRTGGTQMPDRMFRLSIEVAARENPIALAELIDALLVDR